MTFLYLDNNATTAVDPLVMTAMEQSYRDTPANPASQHQAGQQARQAIDFLVGHDVRARKEWEIRTEDFPRHTVPAAHVAAVCDGDSQGPQGAPPRVQ